MKYPNQVANLDFRENHHFLFFSHNVKNFLSNLSTMPLLIHLLSNIAINIYRSIHPSVCSKSDETVGKIIYHLQMNSQQKMAGTEGNVNTCRTVTKVTPSICLRFHCQSSYQSQPCNPRWWTFFELVYFLAQKTRSFGPFRLFFLQIYALFGVFFTNLYNVVVYQNGQI